jgi:hypothetical protein
LPSRKAVKRLLGFKDDTFSELHSGGREYRYDPVELAGRIRDKLFYGTPLRPDDLTLSVGDASELLSKHSPSIASELMGFCESQLMVAAKRLAAAEKRTS